MTRGIAFRPVFRRCTVIHDTDNQTDSSQRFLSRLSRERAREERASRRFHSRMKIRIVIPEERSEERQPVNDDTSQARRRYMKGDQGQCSRYGPPARIEISYQLEDSSTTETREHSRIEPATIPRMPTSTTSLQSIIPLARRLLLPEIANRSVVRRDPRTESCRSTVDTQRGGGREVTTAAAAATAPRFCCCC